MEPLRHLFVATDFHAPSLRGLDYAARLARSVGGHITLFHACESPLVGYGPAPVATSRSEIHGAATHELHGLAESLRTSGIDAEVLVADGPAAPAIVAAVREHGPDLVVIGTHGRRGLARAVLGSVAEHVVRLCATPVVTLHEWYFEDRAEASARLAKRAASLAGQVDVAIAITRGAVRLAIEAGRAARVRADTFVVEPILLDGVALGALAEDETALLEGPAQAPGHASSSRLSDAVERARTTAEQRGRWLRSEPIADLTGYAVLLVADVLTTPSVARLAARSARERGAKHVTLAVPVCAADALAALTPDVDRTVCLETAHFAAASAHPYRVEDEPTNIEAADMLVRASALREHGARAH